MHDFLIVKKTKELQMKKHTYSKARGTRRVNNQQTNFELKHRVVHALNKLADRDTYQIGVEDLEKTIECLNPEGVAPFLSCILDTDSEQKSAVRKECVRLMGVLTSSHEGLIGPHIAKIVNSIVKRLKDSDSVVRDACVETAGVLASKMGSGNSENDGFFVVLVKPLFEALGEQNKHIQSGSALCLARVIDNTNDPPENVLQRMLMRTVKLLKNPHFLAKPAVIELNRSIIQAGGAQTKSGLSAAMKSIQESLKDADWATRKAAAAALSEIASSCSDNSHFASFKSSCIRSLQSCRFDKVKPVRDVVLQSLHLWRSVPGSDTTEFSEAGSSIKENFFGGDYGDITSASESTSKDISMTKWVPIACRKTGHNYTANPQNSKGTDDWHVEIAIPKNQHQIVYNDESEGSSITKSLERVISTDISSNQYIGYEYVQMDEKQECSNGLMKSSMGISQRFDGEVDGEEKSYMTKIRDRRSLDSTVTDLTCQNLNGGCCLQMANEMVSVRKQLLEIENKQSDLLDILKVFTTGTMESLSVIQKKVSNLEHIIDRLTQENKRVLKRDASISSSPRLSTHTPRSSTDVRTRPSAAQLDDKTYSRSKLSTSSSTKQVVDTWPDSIDQKSYHNRSPTNIPGHSRSLEVKGYIAEEDLDCTFKKALCCADDLVLIELISKTGPVLESLSHETANSVLSNLVLYLREHRFVNYAIPWLQQIVDLSSIHGPNCLAISSKAKRDIMCGIQEAVNTGGFSNSADRRYIIDILMKLQQIWGKCLP